MKKFKIIAAVVVAIALILGFYKCSSIGVAGPVQADETTGGAVDITPIPANSEFLKDESE